METDQGFRNRILSNPLYFGPVVQHYAALTRDDTDALAEVHRLLDQQLLLMGNDARSFSADPAREGKQLSEAEILQRISSFDSPTDASPSEEEASEDESDWLDLQDEQDLHPFPFDDIDTAPLAFQMMARLALVSAVLRDSELVTDLGLKQRVLWDALLMWATLVSVLEQDTEFGEFARMGAEAVASFVDIDERHMDEFVSEFVRWAPMLTSCGGIRATLSSRKLLRVLDRCFSEPDFRDSAATASLGMFMAFDIHADGWTKYLTDLQERHGSVIAVREVLRRIAETAFYEGDTTGHDAPRLREFLVSQYVDDLQTDTDQQRRAAAGRIREQLRVTKMGVLRRRAERAATIGPGEDYGLEK